MVTCSCSDPVLAASSAERRDPLSDYGSITVDHHAAALPVTPKERCITDKKQMIKVGPTFAVRSAGKRFSTESAMRHKLTLALSAFGHAGNALLYYCGLLMIHVSFYCKWR